MPDTNRPLSPHLQVYRPQITSVLSITHRLTGVVLAYVLFRKREGIDTDVSLEDPFKLSPALKFGAFFALILLISKFSSIYFGEAGTYAASVVAGLADVDAITKALGADKRISPHYLKGGPAYGGPCFPRDSRAFSGFARKFGCKAELAEATDKVNENHYWKAKCNHLS